MAGRTGEELCSAATAADAGYLANCSQIVDAFCHSYSLENSRSNSTEVTRAEAYGYGFVMVVVISLLSLLGIIIVPFIRGNPRLMMMYKYVIVLLISMGVAALVTAALLHLIPNAIGLHSHTHNDNDNHSYIELEEADVLWKMCAVLGGAFSFFVLELLLHTCSSRFGHTHSHGGDSTLLESTTSESSLLGGAKGGGDMREREDEGYPHSQPGSLQTEKYVAPTTADGLPHSPPGYGAVEREGNPSDQNSGGCLTCVTSITPLAWVILIGDAMHNMTDGVAVGVAISQSLGLGISTALAILFHEIPHELSDYAILLHTGMSWYKALFLNFVSAVTAMVGFFVGVTIGTNSAKSNEWFLAVIAGQFLYIALVDLLPEVLRAKKKGVKTVVHNTMMFLGMFIGFSILFVIAVFEEKINISVH